MAATEIESPLARLTEEQVEAIGREFADLHDEVFSDLGERDARYIHGIIDLQRRLALLGRVLLLGAQFPPLWLAGTASLSLAKILENMEIGHNVMHGQWDWMNHPVINSASWDWDTASTAEAWKHSHNYIHHTYTNIRGKDKDLGYEIMRIDPHQPWHPVYLLQPLYNLLLMALFEWGVALHDMDLEAFRRGEKPLKDMLKDLRGISGKARRQFIKDYTAFPLLSGLATAAAAGAFVFVANQTERPREGAASRASKRVAGGWRWASRRARRRSGPRVFAEGMLRASFEGVVDFLDVDPDRLPLRSRSKARLKAGRAWRRTRRRAVKYDPGLPLRAGRRSFKAAVVANATANIVRNVWSYSIIFCGHFPDQTYTFSQEETENETEGAKYVRQLVGAANIDGGPLFHVISGNLGFQVEHHLYPDMPSTRYGEIAPRVREICERYELPYNTGPLHTQLGMVHRTILRLAFPGGKPRPKPGPFRRDELPEHDVAPAAAAA